MKILEWMRRKKSQPGEASGERVNESMRNHYRSVAGLPEQRKAWLIDHDGERSYHDLDIQRNGKPHGEVRVTLHSVDDIPEQKVYQFLKEDKGYLIYTEV